MELSNRVLPKNFNSLCNASMKIIESFDDGLSISYFKVIIVIMALVFAIFTLRVIPL